MAKGTKRDSSKEHFWRRLIRGQAGSRLSVRAWCRRHKVHEAAFYWWRRELTRRDAEASKITPSGAAAVSPPAFVPVRLTEDPPARRDPTVEILLSNGRRVRVRGPVDRQMLADVLAALETPPC